VRIMPITSPAARYQEPKRSYDRTWADMEKMLDEAERVQQGWIETFHAAKDLNDRDTMREAARNKKALEGVIKTLKWVLGEEGIQHPLH